MKSHSLGINLDWIGISASVACAIHCLALPFLISALPLLGLEVLANHWIEYSVIILSLLLAVVALSHGFTRHHQRFLPILLVILGFSIILIGLIWGHDHAYGLIETAGPFLIGHLQEKHNSIEHFITPIGALIVALAHYVNWYFIKKSKTGCLLPETKNL